MWRCNLIFPFSVFIFSQIVLESPQSKVPFAPNDRTEEMLGMGEEAPGWFCTFPTNVFSVLLKESVDLGEIMFSLCYLPTAGRLTLTVIKCRNLKAMDITGYSGGCLVAGEDPLAPTFPPLPSVYLSRRWVNHHINTWKSFVCVLGANKTF